MNNVFYSDIYFDPIEKYDLKGSTFGRCVLVIEIVMFSFLPFRFVPEHKRATVSTLKDLDIVENKRKIYIPEDIYKKLTKQLRKDADFLADHKVISILSASFSTMSCRLWIILFS